MGIPNLCYTLQRKQIRDFIMKTFLPLKVSPIFILDTFHISKTNSLYII